MRVRPLTFRDEKLSATISARDDALWITIRDLSSGKQWGESPLLHLDVYSKMEKRLETCKTYRVDAVERVEGGAHVAVGDSWRKISVGLWLRIRDGELSVFLQPMELYESWAEMYRLFAIDLFPGLMRSGRGGKLFLPLMAGVECDPSNKPRIRDRFLIYGEQERWELLPTLPFCAAVAQDGGLMALATRGACDAECRVETHGDGSGSAGLGFSFRRDWANPVDFENREIRFIPIPPGERAVRFCAKRIRRHVMDDLGKPRLLERAGESPQVAYLLGAYIMKMFFAIQNDAGVIRTVYNTKDFGGGTSLDVMMTFAEAKRCLRKIHAAGIDRVLTEGVGWNPRGHDGMYPTRLPPDERLGGEDGFRDLIAFGNALGYNISVHDNYIDAYRVAPNWDPETTIHDAYGEPLVSGYWGGGINYRQWPLAFPYDRLEGQMRATQAYGLRGMYYCDGMGNPLECNHHPLHRGPRSGHARGICRIIETARKVYGSAGTECGFLYCVVPSDCIAMNGMGRSLEQFADVWPVTSLCDRHVPVWHLALHDLVVLEGHGLRWQDVMRKVLYGLHPRTEWSSRPGLFPVPDASFVAALKADYDLTLGRFGCLQTLEMTDWRELADGVFKTSFEDGTEITADFNKRELFANGKKLHRPKGLLPDRE